MNAPVFHPGSSSFPAPFGHALFFNITHDRVAAVLSQLGTDSRVPLAVFNSPAPVYVARFGGARYLAIGNCHVHLFDEAFERAVAFLRAHAAFHEIEVQV